MKHPPTPKSTMGTAGIFMSPSALKEQSADRVIADADANTAYEQGLSVSDRMKFARSEHVTILS